ncbi:DoxX family protein [Hoyosella subflava]|uniref:DoxX family protein n=1 Tax=Hoyosella subflava (strain DSM 45089 / JCM 17490 / NBRC 109087 / DQS3-9A1) TaxID=443218 RepID=F6ER71_HOYSD|nr:DoxX family protein [Hoyosella subflava]AEF41949.1 DoxX family protein [Hoyosella subflava DQS3-9A1]
MDLVLWIPAALLAAAFLLSGVTKTSTPYEKYVTKKGADWAQEFSPGAVRAIGIVEILGAVGLVLPQATGLYPILTPIAAVGLAILLVLAMIVLRRRAELSSYMPLTGTLFVLCVAVAVGRFLT